jgi:DNA mismatch repair protein MutL
VVDVNVHPQKAEVRFADGRALFDAITRELHTGLARAFGLPALGVNPYVQAHALRNAVPTLRDGGGGNSAGGDGNGFGGWPDRGPGPGRGPAATSSGSDAGAAGPGLFGVASLFTSATSDAAGAAAPGPGLFADDPGLYATLRFVGQVRATFLVCEGMDGMYVLDQHAAAERVTFDRLRRAHAARGVGMQRLLVPEIVELTPPEVALLEEHADEVAQLGVEVRAVSDAAVAVHGVPELLLRQDPARLARDLASELSRAAGRPFGGAVDLVLATMACHGSVRAGDAVGREAAEALLRALDHVDFAGHCPHGRPLIMRLSWSELERRVGR